jgi:hypothetical protein
MSSRWLTRCHRSGLPQRYSPAPPAASAATLGLVGVEYVSPVGVRGEYRDNRGGDDLDQLSRCDGPLALSLSPPGVYATGRAPAHIPAPAPVDTDCCGIEVLPNFDIVALDGLLPADALLLDAFADKTSDRVWTLSAVSLLSALDTERTLKELRCYRARASSQPLPRTVAPLLDDTETWPSPPRSSPRSVKALLTRGYSASKVSIVQRAAPLRSILASLVISGTPKLSARAT